MGSFLPFSPCERGGGEERRQRLSAGFSMKNAIAFFYMFWVAASSVVSACDFAFPYPISTHESLLAGAQIAFKGRLLGCVIEKKEKFKSMWISRCNVQVDEWLKGAGGFLSCVEDKKALKPLKDATMCHVLMDEWIRGVGGRNMTLYAAPKFVCDFDGHPLQEGPANYPLVVYAAKYRGEWFVNDTRPLGSLFSVMEYNHFFRPMSPYAVVPEQSGHKSEGY